MKKVLHTYRLRLTNLSQANRSLRLGRLSKRRDMDFRDLGFLEKESAEELLAKLIAGKDLRLINKLDPRYEPTNVADQRLTRIYRTVRTLFEETGTYDLFVGYPFVEGKFLDGTIVRCPVLLFPVRLIRNLQGRPRWKLEVLEEEAVSFNKTFLLAYEQFQQLRLPPEIWEAELDPKSDWREWLTQLHQLVKQHELEVNVNPRLFDLKLDRVEDYLKAQMDTFKTGLLTFRSQAVLGVFPQSDSALLQDYEVLEKQGEQFELERLFEPSVPRLEEQTYIKEEDRYFVTEVDQSQEAALLAIKQGESRVIHGPPGTGKSQVIVNLIADAMAHGKRVLLVSQKRAALDVVYHRLSALGLGRFATLVHDYRHDRANIYRNLKRQIDEIPLFQQELKDLNGTQMEHDYKLLSRQVDQLGREFEELYQGLTQRESFGISLHELYLHSDPTAEHLELGELSRGWKQAQLDEFLEHLGQIYDYADLMRSEHPWHARVSFRHYQPIDQSRLQEKLNLVAASVESLHQQYRQLSKRLSTRILDPVLNRQRISAFRKLDELIRDHQTREGMEALHFGKLKAEQVSDLLEDFAQATEQLEKRQLLDDGHWSLYENLLRHSKAYRAHQKASFRYFSLPYQRARWFWKKLLARQEKELNATSFQRLSRETKWFQKLHRLFAKVHDQRFWSDFPLYGSQNEKREWLAQRQEWLAAYQHYQSITFFRKVKPRFGVDQFDRSKWQESLREIEALENFEKARVSHRQEWATFLHKTTIQALEEAVKDPAPVAGLIEALKQSLDKDFADLVELDRLLIHLTHQEQKILEVFQPLLDQGLSESDLLGTVRNSVYLAWIAQAEHSHPILSAVSGRGWQRKQRDFADKLAERRTRIARLIQRRLKEQVVEAIEYNRLKNRVTYRTIHHQVSKKRRLWSVRRLVQETWEQGLWRLMPCWMASPESVAAIFPMQADFFDLVVFDEASQCFVERAIPVLMRGKTAVIAGDDKQLQPLNLYQVRYEEGEEAFVENEIALEVESILDLAKTSFAESRLSWHYRSQQEALINFSNHAFYEGQLQVMPQAEPSSQFHPPLEWLSVEGAWRQNRNEPEARKVLEVVMKWVRQPQPPSTGIVTFNFHQQELIKDLLDQELERLAASDQEGYECLQRAIHRTEEEEYQGLFVKNIENVQGDERDIIIFSIGYGYNDRGKLSTNFGLLNQRGGENRLNVAISRARQKSYVVCSFLPGELQVDNAANPGPRFFRDYLRFAKAISDQREQDALRLLNQQNDTDISLLPENPLADQIAAALQARGYTILRHVGDTSYKLDLAVKASPEAENFLLGIEVEGSYYFSGQDSKEREIYRKALLQQRGWKVHRVWARNVWLDAEKEVERIVRKLEG
ncbi:MAG: AAA domain-containing protein [Bacteroidota bacterium]